jgi:hypothetical protein
MAQAEYNTPNKPDFPKIAAQYSSGAALLHHTRRPLPVTQAGDFLIISNAGAYGYVMANNYNSKSLVAEVLIEKGRPHLVRRRQTLENLIAHESIPG